MPHYPRQLPTFDYRGFHRYFLTFCTFERIRYFEQSECGAIALEQILRAGTQHAFAIAAVLGFRNLFARHGSSMAPSILTSSIIDPQMMPAA